MVLSEKIRLFNILLADDGTDNMRAAIQFLAELPHEKDCAVNALRVFTPTEGSEFSRIEAETQHTRNYLKSRHFHYRSELIQGNPSEIIIQHAESSKPDLVVLGSKATGKFAGLLGNVASDVVHSGKWPVLIAREPYTGLKKVLLVTDGSDASHITAQFLESFPMIPTTTVEILHVVQPVQVTYPIEPAGMAIATLSPEEEERMNQENIAEGEKILTTTHALLPSLPNVRTHLLVGDPVEQIVHFIKQEQIDLLVCGSRGIGNFAGWLLGSISRDLVRLAPCSVLVYRS